MNEKTVPQAPPLWLPPGNLRRRDTAAGVARLRLRLGPELGLHWEEEPLLGGVRGWAAGWGGGGQVVGVRGSGGIGLPSSTRRRRGGGRLPGRNVVGEVRCGGMSTERLFWAGEEMTYLPRLSNDH